MNAACAIAAACVALAWLVAEQGLMRCKALRQAANRFNEPERNLENPPILRHSGGSQQRSWSSRNPDFMLFNELQELDSGFLRNDPGFSRCPGATLLLNTPEPLIRSLTKLLIGALLSGAMAAAIVTLLADSLHPAFAALIGYLVAASACAALLHQRHRTGLATALPWILAMLAPLFVALACITHDAQSWLIGGFALAFALALGIPAFSALAQRFDDAEVPAFMPPLPARALATSIIALAMAGSLSW